MLRDATITPRITERARAEQMNAGSGYELENVEVLDPSMRLTDAWSAAACAVLPTPKPITRTARGSSA